MWDTCERSPSERPSLARSHLSLRTWTVRVCSMECVYLHMPCDAGVAFNGEPLIVPHWQTEIFPLQSLNESALSWTPTWAPWAVDAIVCHLNRRMEKLGIRVPCHSIVVLQCLGQGASLWGSCCNSWGAPYRPKLCTSVASTLYLFDQNS